MTFTGVALPNHPFFALAFLRAAASSGVEWQATPETHEGIVRSLRRRIVPLARRVDFRNRALATAYQRGVNRFNPEFGYVRVLRPSNVVTAITVELPDGTHHRVVRVVDRRPKAKPKCKKGCPCRAP